MDADQAVDLYRSGRTIRQVAGELGVPYYKVREVLNSAGVIVNGRRPTLPESVTSEIVELHDAGKPMAEIAQQVGMSEPGAWSRYKKARPHKPPRRGRWQLVLTDALAEGSAVAVRTTVEDHLGREPTRAELNAARRAAHSLVAAGQARAVHVQASSDDSTGDRIYLVLVRPNSKAASQQLERRASAAVQKPGDLHNQQRTVERLSRTLGMLERSARSIQAEALNDATP